MSTTIENASSNIQWIILECPVFGGIFTQILEIVEQKPEPWRLHAKQSLLDSNIILNKTKIIVALSETDGLIGFVWLSYPDLSILCQWKAYCFIFHVYVKPKYRNFGIGSKGIKLAVSLAKMYNCDGVLLVTDNSNLKEKFYYKFGFRNIVSDPLLLKKSFQRKVNSQIFHNNKPATIRSVNFHDLATIQSINAQPHWIVNNGNVKRTQETEVEETFVELFHDNRTHQFVISGTFKGNSYVSWIVEKKFLLTQCVLYKKDSCGDLRIISSKVQAAFDSAIHLDVNRLNEFSIVVDGLCF